MKASESFEPFIPPKKVNSKVTDALKWLESAIAQGEDYAEYNVNIHVHGGVVKTVEKMVKIRER